MSLAVIGAIAIGDYEEGAAVVVLFALSDWLETKATAKARNAIEAIISLRPEVAVLADSGETVEVEKVAVGTRVAVKSGDKVPIDGVVDDGETALDESNLTGESRLLRSAMERTKIKCMLSLREPLC